ncbi:cuticle protein 14 isoform b [Trichonephila clavata]|uniref:Cuticle protein 14 isoform b n=1 Tax=Trichonephila clavata TaxID=2740835 RepID=A0A8X6GG41_TRICU|nr:cuticle protein 14 isoform b [Trichonephila clavata]
MSKNELSCKVEIRTIIWIFIGLGVTCTLANKVPHRTSRKLLEFSNDQNSRGFGYSVKDEDLQSGHFRKEQRDQHGVVRGSYGLRDPNGSFRLVRYIADDKGFRVDISSNEPGIGRQNPASVSVNRFSHLPEDKKTLSTITRHFDDQDNRDVPESQNWPSNYDFYVPITQKGNLDESPKKKPIPIDLHKHLFNAGFYDQSQIPRRNIQQGVFPLRTYDEKYKTDFNLQDTSEESLKLLGGKDFRIWPDNASLLPPIGRTTNTEMRNIGSLPPRFTGGDILLTHKDTRTNKLEKTPPGISSNLLQLLLNYPQQKVHTDLPDCETVSSAVLCKPPLFYTNNYAYFNLSDVEGRPLDEQKSIDSQRRLSSDEQKLLIEAAFAERLHKFVSTGDGKFPSNTVLSRLPLQNNAFNQLVSSKDNSQKSTPCSDNQEKYGKDTEDLALTNTLNRPVIYNTISNTHINSMLKYGSDWNPSLASGNVQQSNQEVHTLHSSIPTSDINSNMYKDLHDHKKLVLLTLQNGEKSDTSFLDLLKNLNVLGLIIFPEDGGKSREKLIEHFANKAEHGRNEEKVSKSTANGLVQKVTEVVSEPTPTFPNATTKENTSNSSEYGTNNTTVNQPLTVQDRKEPIHKLLLKNSEFLILDDIHSSESGDYGLPPTLKPEASTDAPDWKKAFEDEMKQEYERTLNKSLSDDESMLPLPPNRGIPNERVYSIPDPLIPLYDSRGVPVKSENVPLHLHRYVAPTGITSLPWKFAIPRPAPPRSLVIPPKPSD